MELVAEITLNVVGFKLRHVTTHKGGEELHTVVNLYLVTAACLDARGNALYWVAQLYGRRGAPQQFHRGGLAHEIDKAVEGTDASAEHVAQAGEKHVVLCLQYVTAVLENSHHFAIFHKNGFFARVDGQDGMGIEIFFGLLPDEHSSRRSVFQRLKYMFLAALISRFIRIAE